MEDMASTLSLIPIRLGVVARSGDDRDPSRHETLEGRSHEVARPVLP